VLLDLNLPKMDGMEVLEQMKTSWELRTIPVVALTTSTAERDLLRAYGSYVNAYVTKPLGVDEFIRTVRSVEDFYLRTVQLPQTPGWDPSELLF
jgi:CheY-like chemotaxis protein